MIPKALTKQDVKYIVFVDHGLRVGSQDRYRDFFSIVAVNDAIGSCAMQFYDGGEGGAFALDHTLPVHAGWCAGEQRAAPPPTLLGDYVMPNCAGG